MADENIPIEEVTRRNLDRMAKLLDEIELVWEHRAPGEWPTEERFERFSDELTSFRAYLLPSEKEE